MISTIENFITDLLDEMLNQSDEPDIEYLFLETGRNPYYLSRSLPITVTGAPGSQQVDLEELIEDMKALGMALVPDGEYYYRHVKPDPWLRSQMRMKVTCHAKEDGRYIVNFRKLLDGEAARPTAGKQFQPSSMPPSNANTAVKALGQK